jgi:hypothetical protein
MFATATAGSPAFRAIAAADLPSPLSSGTAITNAALTTPAVTTSIAPASAGASTLGTTALEWGNLYLTDSAVIYAQADQSNSMTSSATGWTFNQPVTFGPQTTTAGSIYFQEGSGGGTNKVRLQGAASTADVTVTLPAATGTITVGPTSTTAGEVWTATAVAGVGAWASPGATDPELAAIAGLTFADASIIQLTGASAAATLTSGGNNYFLKSTSDNSALEFATPAASLTALGAAPLAAPVFTTSIEAPYLILGSAATAADAGAIRMPNAAYIMSEADVAGTDISVIGVDSAEIIQIGASGASSVTITPNTTITGDVTVSGADVILASTTAGVRLTGGNGLLTIKGEGDGTDEDLTINLNSANVATVSSSTGVTDVNFSAINLITTGNMAGGVNRIGTFASPITSTGAYTLTAANCYNSILFYNDTDAINLPAAVAGMNLMIYVTGTNLTTIDPNGSDVIVRDGTAQTGGVTMTLSGAAGNYVTLFADAVNHWVTGGFKGTLSAGS